MAMELRGGRCVDKKLQGKPLMHGSHFGHRDLVSLPPASVGVALLDHLRKPDQRMLAEESPIALVYDGSTLAVIMATPADLTDLALGFSLTEGIIRHASEIERLDIVPGADGIELRMWLAQASGRRVKARRRRMVGPTGCGLCGIESLSEASRPNPKLERRISLAPSQIARAVEALSAAQALNGATHATHAAGFYVPDDGLVLAREDVGRHNALDKLAGALAGRDLNGARGAIILTSRVSVEMVQKAAVVGSCLMVAVSAPTALAVRTAEACGMTLVGVARGSEYEIFTHPEVIRT
jgi:FdhD protein